MAIVYTKEWRKMVREVDALATAKLTDKQIDKIYEAADNFMDGDNKKAYNKFRYWAKKIGWTKDVWWLFEWVES